MFKFFSIKKLSLSFFILLIISLNFIFALPKTSATEASSTQASQTRGGVYYRPNLFIPGMEGLFTEFRTKNDPVTGISYKEYKINGASLAKYIKVVYTYAGIMAGAFAMFMLVYGAWQWLMAAGNASKITMAKETVSTTLIGLAFLFGGYLLLSQISTRLVNLQPLQVKDVSITERCGIFKEQPGCERNNCIWQPIAAQSADQPASGTCIAPAGSGGQRCPIEDSGLLQDIYFPEILTGGRIGVNYGETSDPRLTAETINALRSIAFGLDVNEKLIVNSAFRTWQKQEFYYNCYQQKLQNKPCPAGCGRCNKASPPSCTSSHQTGTAVDICYQDFTPGRVIDTCNFVSETYNCLNNSNPPCTPRLQEAENRLQDVMEGNFNPISEEWWHFNLKR